MRRRKFLKYMSVGTGGTIGAFSIWASTSRSRAARWFRTIAADVKRPILPPAVKPIPAKWSDNDVTICWLGHASVLINFYGINILTDPSLGRRVGISTGIGTAGPKRYIAPALTVKELPRIDVLLLSHAHMDHMDMPTLRHLNPSTFVITAKLTQDVLQGTGLNQISELAWNETATFQNQKGKLLVESFQVKHWGQRWPSELERGYNGYILRREDKTLLFGGDTANTPLFKEVRSKGPFAAALMPIGAYDPWIRNHCTPEQALEMANAAGADYILPIHHQTFKLSNEPMREPIERLQAALQHEPQRLGLKQVGESFVCPKV